jgi:hypothetical protein
MRSNLNSLMSENCLAIGMRAETASRAMRAQRSDRDGSAIELPAAWPR